MVLSISFLIIWGIVIWKLNNEFSKDTTEVGATWFGILNSFFIIALAPLFSKWWESKYNPSAAFKYGFGLGLLGFGFALLAYGSSGIPQGAANRIGKHGLVDLSLFVPYTRRIVLIAGRTILS